MPEPLRSPKQSRAAAKSRSHPYARPANSHRAREDGLTRSNSILGTIKSFVTAPLSWLSLSDGREPGISPQKRRASGTERGSTPPKAKRARRSSPDRGGYLDPPTSLLTSKRPPIPLWNNVNGVAPARTMSIDPPPLSAESIEVSLLPSRGPSNISRTSMSVEPQGSSVIRRSSTRDLSIPPPSPFARSFSRSSLTPQPSGATFGPSPKRKTRESTAPPLLGSPSSTPTFTRPPTSTGQQSLFHGAPSRGRSEGPISALLGRNRDSVSPLRGSPSRGMLIADNLRLSRSPNKTAVERTLSTLESFRTTLPISRFPSAPLAEERRLHKVHVPEPSKLRFDHTPEGRKEKTKRAPNIVGPYSSGMSGMRKLLARRREELEQELEVDLAPENVPYGVASEEAEMEYEVQEGRKEKGKAKHVEVEENTPESRKAIRPQVNGVVKTDTALPRTRSPPRPKSDSPQSTLRAPNSRVSRTHAPAPRLKKSRNKFNLDDDDEPEWSMSIEEVKSFQAQVAKAQQAPLSLRRMSEAGMQTDMDATSPRAASPPLPSQPRTFDSLLSRIGPPTTTASKPTTEFPPAPQQPKADALAQVQSTPPEGASSAPTTLPFSLGTPAASTAIPAEVVSGPFTPPTTTPSPAPAPSAPASGISGVPSFFANTKTQFTPPKLPAVPLFGSPPPHNGRKDGAEPRKDITNNVFGASGETKKEEKKPEAKPSPFGGVSKPSVFGGSPQAFGGLSSSANVPGDALTNAAPPFSGLGPTPASGSADVPARPSFTFGVPPTVNGDTKDTPKPSVGIFNSANKPDVGAVAPAAEVPSKPAFSFAAPASSSTPSADKPNGGPATPAADTSSKPTFSFGAPATSTTPATDAPKPLFSFGVTAPSQSKTPVTDAPSPFSFGAAPSTPPPADKKPSFTFGASSGTGSSGFSFGAEVPANGTSEAPKPLFGGFGSTNTQAAPKTPDPPPVENGDRMEVHADRMEESPTRTIEKKDTAIPQLQQSSPFTAFGHIGGSTGFSFGQDKPATSTISFGQPKPFTSTAFSFGQQNTDKAGTTSTGFSFGNNASKPAGQLFSAPANSPNPFGSTTSNAASSSAFSFGQPSSNTPANPFGQPQQPENGSSSAPSSPSLFPQPQPQSPSFSFNVGPSNNAFPSSGTPAATPSTPGTGTQPFQFGTPSTAVPQQQQQQQQQQPGGNAMFTLGGAATPPRRVKGLPNRRAKRP